MQQAGGTAPQSGGFVDPGLAALIAALLSGSIGGYGFIADKNRSDEAIRNDAISSMTSAQAAIVREAEDAKTEYAELKKSNLEMAKKNAALSKEVEELKGKYSRSLALSGPSATFQKASVDTIKNSVDATIQALQSLTDPNYAWMKGKDLKNLRKALAYPTTALVRPSLSNLYDKIILAAAEMDKSAVGGTSRRRRYRRKMRGSGINDAPDTSDNEALNRYVILVDKSKTAPLVGDDVAAIDELRQKLATFDEGKETLIANEPDVARQLGLDVPAVAAEVPTVTVPFFPPFEEFAKLYENALQGSLVSVKQGLQSKSQERMDKKAAQKATKAAEKASAQDKKDDGAAVKAAEELSKKFQKAKTDAETKVLKAQITAQTLGLEDAVQDAKTTYDNAKSQVDKFLGTTTGGAFSFFKSKADLTEIAEVPGAWTTVQTPGENQTPRGTWAALKDPALKLLDQYKAAADAYVAAIDEAKKAAKKGFTLESRKLFEIPTFKWSPSNPFAGILDTLSKSKDQSKALAENQALMKEAIQFIKGMVKKAEKVLPELKDFGYAAQEEAEAKMRAVRSDKATRIGRGRRRRGGAESPLCALLKQDDSYTNGDLLWFYVNVRAVLNGGVLKAKDTTIKWIQRAVPDPSKDTPRTALKFLLAKLDTGFLSGTKTWFRGVFGRMKLGKDGDETPEASTFLENAVLAGEAFIILKCLVDKAVELVNARIKTDSVAKKNARLAARNKAISAERAAAQDTATALQKKIQEAISAREAIFKGLQEQVVAVIGAITPFTKARENGGSAPNPTVADALTTAQGLLQDSSSAFETLRMSPGFQSFINLGDRSIPGNMEAIDKAEDEFADTAAAFDAAAEEVYAGANLSLQNAKKQAGEIPELLKKLEEIVPPPVEESEMNLPELLEGYKAPTSTAPAAPVTEPVQPLQNKTVDELKEMLRDLQSRASALRAIAYGPDGRWAYAPGQDAEKDKAVDEAAPLETQARAVQRELDTRPEYVKARTEKTQSNLQALRTELENVTNKLTELRSNSNEDEASLLAVRAAEKEQKELQMRIRSLEYTLGEQGTGAPSRGTSEPGTPSTTPKADDTGIEMVNLGPSSAPVAAAADGPPGPGIEMVSPAPTAVTPAQSAAPVIEGLGMTPADAVRNPRRPKQARGSDSALGQSGRNLVNPPSKKTGGKKSRRKSRKGSRKSRKRTLKKRRGGK